MVTPLAVARPPADVAHHRLGVGHPRADEEHPRALAATTQLAHVGVMAKRRRTRRAVKAGHQKIVAVPRVLAQPKAGTIHVGAIAAQATAHRAPGRLAVMPVHQVQAVVRAIAARRRPEAAAATVAAATTATITVADPVVDQAMAVVAAAAATVVKVTAHRAHAGGSVVSRRKVAASGLATTVAIRAATLATTAAHLRRVPLTAAVTTQADRTARRAPVAEAAAGAIAMA